MTKLLVHSHQLCCLAVKQRGSYFSLHEAFSMTFCYVQVCVAEGAGQQLVADSASGVDASGNACAYAILASDLIAASVLLLKRRHQWHCWQHVGMCCAANHSRRTFCCHHKRSSAY